MKVAVGGFVRVLRKAVREIEVGRARASMVRERAEAMMVGCRERGGGKVQDCRGNETRKGCDWLEGDDDASVRAASVSMRKKRALQHRHQGYYNDQNLSFKRSR